MLSLTNTDNLKHLICSHTALYLYLTVIKLRDKAAQLYTANPPADFIHCLLLRIEMPSPATGVQDSGCKSSAMASGWRCYEREETLNVPEANGTIPAVRELLNIAVKELRVRYMVVTLRSLFVTPDKGGRAHMGILVTVIYIRHGITLRWDYNTSLRELQRHNEIE